MPFDLPTLASAGIIRYDVVSYVESSSRNVGFTYMLRDETTSATHFIPDAAIYNAHMGGVFKTQETVIFYTPDFVNFTPGRKLTFIPELNSTAANYGAVYYKRFMEYEYLGYMEARKYHEDGTFDIVASCGAQQGAPLAG